MMVQEQTFLISDSVTFVYRRRWWILAVFCLSAAITSASWNTWGPISESIEEVFGWSNGKIALLHLFGNITYFLLAIPVCLVMDTKGLRFSMIACSIAMLYTTGTRCITQSDPVFSVLVNIGSAVQGFAGVIPYAGPSLVAAVWFPVEERPTATAIVSFFDCFGVSASFIIGSYLVPGPIHCIANGSANNTVSNESNFTDVVNLKELKSGISYLMFVQFGWSILLFTLTLVCFPDKPPKPPSITASIERTVYRKAIGQIIRNGPLWLVSLAGALPTGVELTWISLIDVIVKSIGVSQVDAGWIGFFGTTIGCLSGIFVARYSSLFYGRRKFCIAFLFTLAALCVVWFALICESVLPYSLISLYVACTLIGIFTHGTFPLFYELASETAYPVGEGVIGGFFTVLHTTSGGIFLGFIMMPGIGIKWISWVLFGALCISIPLLLIFPERYKRSDIDTNNVVD